MADANAHKELTEKELTVRFAALEERVQQLERKQDRKASRAERRASRASRSSAAAEGLEIEMAAADNFPRPSVQQDGDNLLRSMIAVAENQQDEVHDGKVSTESKEWDDSVWEVCIVIGLPGVSNLNSFLIGFALFMNVFAQLVFTYTLAFSMTGNDFTSAADLASWRKYVGQHHSFVQEGQGQSLATRLCAQDDSLWTSQGQRDTYDNIEDYLKPLMNYDGLPTGGVLVVVAIFVWCMAVLQEMWKAINFAQCVLELPRSDRTELERCGEESDEEQLEIVSISPRRLALLFVVAVLRIGVAASLLWYGSVWLTETDEISDVILNAVAMMFVLDIDEFIFNIGIALPGKVLFHSLKPLPRKTFLTGGVDTPPLFNIVFISVFLFMVFSNYTAPRIQAMRDGREQLCGGNTNFAVGLHPATGLMASTFTPAVNMAASSQQFWSDAVQELITSNDNSIPRHSLFVGDPAGNGASSWNEFVVMMGQSVQQWAYDMKECTDFPDLHEHDETVMTPFQVMFQNFTRPIYAAVDRQLKSGILTGDSVNVTATSCQSLEFACTLPGASLVRVICPQTCGCADPRSGLMFSTQSEGCNQIVCEISPSYTAALGQILCSDPDAPELLEQPGWIAFLLQMPYLSEDPRFDHWFGGRNAAGLRERNATADFLNEGCGALSHAGEDGDADYQGLFCADDNNNHMTLHAFCPISCGCRNNNIFETELKRCPSSCTTTTTTTTTMQADPAGPVA